MSAAWQAPENRCATPAGSIASSALLTRPDDRSWAIPACSDFPGHHGWTLCGQRDDISMGAFLFYVATYGIDIFFNAALAICVLRNLGERPSRFSRAARRATLFPDSWLGVVVGTRWGDAKTIEGRSGFIGDCHKNAGAYVDRLTFLVVPVLVAEREGPVDAVRESAQIDEANVGGRLWPEWGSARSISCGQSLE